MIMLKVSDKVLFQKLGDEAVILHLDSEEYFGLDSIGTRMWELLLGEGEGNIDKSIPLLLEEYEVEENRLKEDMNELVIALKAEKILVNQEN